MSWHKSPSIAAARRASAVAITLQRGDEAAGYLVSLVADGREDDALFVLEVLAEMGVDYRLRERLAEVVGARRSRELSRAIRALEG